MFPIHTNDLPKVINKAHIVLYANGTSVAASRITKETTSALLIEQFRRLLHWFSNNGLKLTPDKAKLTNFPLNHRHSPQNDLNLIWLLHSGSLGLN